MGLQVTFRPQVERLVGDIGGPDRAHIVLVLLDGLGSAVLRQHLPPDAFLRTHNDPDRLVAVFPATTPAALGPSPAAAPLPSLRTRVPFLVPPLSLTSLRGIRSRGGDEETPVGRVEAGDGIHHTPWPRPGRLWGCIVAGGGGRSLGLCRHRRRGVGFRSGGRPLPWTGLGLGWIGWVHGLGPSLHWKRFLPPSPGTLSSLHLLLPLG